MPCINLYTHHFNLLTLQHSQDEMSTEQLLIKNNTHYVFDTESIQEVDNFTINTDIFTTQTECLNTIQQDLLPISIVIPKYLNTYKTSPIIKSLPLYLTVVEQFRRYTNVFE